LFSLTSCINAVAELARPTEATGGRGSVEHFVVQIETRNGTSCADFPDERLRELKSSELYLSFGIYIKR